MCPYRDILCHYEPYLAILSRIMTYIKVKEKPPYSGGFHVGKVGVSTVSERQDLNLRPLQPHCRFCVDIVRDSYKSCHIWDILFSSKHCSAVFQD